MSDKPGSSKRAMQQLAAQARVKLRRVEEIYKKKPGDECYIVTHVSDANTVEPLSPVAKERSQQEPIELDEEEVTIKIEAPGCDPLSVNNEHEDSLEVSSMNIDVGRQEKVAKAEAQKPPYKEELKTTPGTKVVPSIDVRQQEKVAMAEAQKSPYKEKLKTTPGTKVVPFRATPSKKVSIPGPWTPNDISIRINDFTKKRSLLIPAPDHPAKYYDYFIDDDYLSGIVASTNECVAKRKNNRQDTIYLRNWVDLTVAEFKVFIALLLHTGTSKHQLLGDYWRQHWLYKSCFPDYMTSGRFQMILQYLSLPGFEREKKMTHNRLNHPIADHFNSVMEKLYYPGRELTISVSKINFGAPSDQEFPLKVVSLHKADEPIVKIVMDARRNVAMDVEAVMCKLLEGKRKVGHAIYVDSATTPIVPAFVTFLLRHGTYCTGILDDNRFQVPIELIRAKLEPGETASVFHEGLHIGRHEFQDGAILYVTSEFKKETEENELPKPLRVYNEMTSDVDPHEDMLNYFPWKTYTMAPLKKLFIYTLLLGMSNAHKLCNMFSNSKLTYAAYRLLVLERLLPAVPELPERPIQLGSSGGSEVVQSSHKLVKIPKFAYRMTDGNKCVKFTVRRDCKNCRNVKQTRTNTIYQCDGCEENPALCMKCFFELHSFQGA